VAEIAPWLASHRDVDALDLTGVPLTDGGELATSLEAAAADTLTRVRRPEPDADWRATPGLDRLSWLVETKTVWHPIGT
jgi:hypothetical protein